MPKALKQKQEYGIPLSRYTVFLQNCPLGHDPKDLDFFICVGGTNVLGLDLFYNVMYNTNISEVTEVSFEVAMKIKVIFLDIDGVLNSKRYDDERSAEDGNIDKSRLVLLSRLIAQTDALVVLSSTWRENWDPSGRNTNEDGKALERCFGEFGITLYDRTPLPKRDRAEEIKAWLELHPEVERFVILDDNKLSWGALEPYTVKTDFRIGRGLEERHIQRALQILSQ